MALLELYVTGPLETNTILIRWNSCCLVIDPGDCSIVAYAVRAGCERTAVIATHSHPDHVAGAECLRERLGAELYMHPADAALVERYYRLARAWGLDPGNPPKPDTHIDEGTHNLLPCAPPIRVIHTPGHTPGSITVSVEGVLAVGDLLFRGSVGRVDLPGGDYEALLASIKKLYNQFPPQTRVIPGHGPTTSLGDEARSNPFVLEALGYY